MTPKQDYVYPIVSECANAKETLKEYNYATFNESDTKKMSFLSETELSIQDFISSINTIKITTNEQ